MSDAPWSSTIRERLGDRGQEVLLSSVDEAKLLECEEVEPRHVLMAILREGRGPACEVLGEHGLTYRTLRTRLRFGGRPLGVGETKPRLEVRLAPEPLAVFSLPGSDLRSGPSLGPEARAVFLDSIREAEGLGSAVVEPEHLLLALTTVEEPEKTFGPTLLGSPSPGELRVAMVIKLGENRAGVSLPHRVDVVSSGAVAAVGASFEGVETYLHRALGDPRRRIDAHRESQILRYERMISDLHQVDDPDPVVYERLMASLLRLLADVLDSDQLPVEAPPEAAEFHSRAVQAVEAASRLGHEDEAADLQSATEAVAALEAAGAAAENLALAVPDKTPSGFAPRAGDVVDGFLDNTQPWAARLERASQQVKSLAKPVGAVAGTATGTGLALKIFLSGPIATLNWLITVIQHVWPG